MHLAGEAEKRLGIKADDDSLEKLRTLLHNAGNEQTLENMFASGEAAAILTVNETYFFRETLHFIFLRQLLPETTGILRICSGATAQGCEAYSIAMLIEDYNKTHPPVSYHIDAFDVNPRVVETAEKGIYGKNCFRDDGSCFRYLAEPYLRSLPRDEYGLDPSLKKNICFFVHNILQPLPSEAYDLIFFRNAFIYFTPQSKAQALSNLAAALTDRGILLTGVAETAGVRHPAFVQRNQGDVFYFEKVHPLRADMPATLYESKRGDQKNENKKEFVCCFFLS